ncbi:TOBE domain-containing protein [Telmatospirillum sp. J64-1]|uniref:TOBE domain-containing protein n=1 Tax=Telmatospirillum sp. J64-1 TaxID=2502183 RepID=UPI00115E06B8|nr:TOBE domain-containing protein [Telmatospirillum sp. J64-1]
MARPSLDPVFSLRDGGVTRVGADRIRLLEAIRDHGSISAAGRAVGITYKAAWDAVAAVNNLFDRPLVVGSPGGRNGGGAVVTPEGEQVIAAFRYVQEEMARFLAGLERRLENPDLPSLNTILWGFLMKTSARNVLRGVVDKIVEGAVNAEVLLTLPGETTLSVIITRESVKDLELVPGKEALALIKSSFVILAREDEVGRTSARNRLCGTVTRREDGAVNSEFTLDIGGGKTISAIVTKESAMELGLEQGDRACALIKASHIILAVE